MNITFEDLLLAYQKVKVDIFYERNNNDLISFEEFESNLVDNLNEILKNINDNNIDYFLENEIIGKYSISLKKLDFDTIENSQFYTDEIEKFENSNLKDIDCRYVGKNSVTFHVISSLWINKIGINLESEIHNCSYGCRLNLENKETMDNTKSEYPQQGNFKPYAQLYGKWQRDHLNATKMALSEGKNVVVFATDFKSFYHSIPAEFIEHYYNENKKDNKFDDLNKLLFLMISKWNEINKEEIKNLEFSIINNTIGLPIGISASKVIANLVLKSFDEEILKNVRPIFYGRYVDDILLVLENTNHIKSVKDIWKLLNKNIVDFEFDHTENFKGQYYLKHLIFDKLYINEQKTKIFLLSKNSGVTIIDKLKKSMNENSSEWRMMPDAEDDLDNLNEEIVSSSKNNDDSIKNFSHFDGISVQRFKFSVRLRNFESLVRNTERKVWSKSLDTFFDTVIEFVITPQNFNKYIKYYPRLFGLCVFANKDDKFKELYIRYNQCWEIIKKQFRNSEKYNEKKYNCIYEYYLLLINENIYCSINFNQTQKDYHWLEPFKICSSITVLFKKSSQLFYCDFHRTPLKIIFFEEQFKNRIYSLNKLSVTKSSKYFKILPIKEIDLLIKKTKVKKIKALQIALSIRKLSILEISMIINFYESKKDFKEFYQIINALGYKINPIKDETIPTKKNITDRHITIDLASSFERNPNLLLTNLKTSDKSWEAVVRDDNYEPDDEREIKLNRLINEILRTPAEIDFVVFPELSIPRQRIIEIAEKLKNRGISIIAGLEYDKLTKQESGVENKTPNMVVNQIIYILTKNENGFNSQISIVQDKIIPAFHEEIELYRIGGKKLTFHSKNKFIIKHKGLTFSGLICNDLLNIDNRQPLRGEIDLLFVVEWNRDVDMYNHIVSSTSNDLHCFVAQVNNRSYGYTLLRGPYRESFKRDVAMIKGGELDNFVLVKVEADELREFQRDFRSPDGPFKPVPTGFKMSELRRETRITKK